MVELSTVASGVVIGLSIAAPIGPMAILCIDRTLRSGIKAGISTGAGASTVHTAYASVVLLGLQHVAPLLANCRPVMSVVSAGLMLLFAWRILRRQPGTHPESDTRSILRSYVSAVAFCLNPMLLVLLVGAVCVVIGPEPPLGPAVSTVLVGVFIGSIGWWIMLSAVTSALQGRFRFAVMQAVDRAVVVGMVGFAMLPLAHVVWAG